MAKVAVITLNYNGKNDSLDLLKSITDLRLKIYESKIIVVDNASNDGSVSEIKQKFPAVDIAQTGSNLGFAGGFNKGIEYAKAWGADYFLLINNDCLIKDHNLIENLIKTADSDPEIGLVSPKIYFAPGFEFHKDRYKKEDWGKVIWFAGGKFDWDNIGSVHRGLDDIDSGKYGQIEESEIFSGACVLIKKEVFEKVSPPAGGFDEKYFLYFEDSDFSIRAKKAGFKIYYNGETSIYHKVSQSTGTGSEITDYFHTRNRLFFGFKYASIRTKFALLREAIKLFFSGRKAQKQGVLDYFLGIKSTEILNAHSRSANTNIEYPFKLSIVTVNYNTPDLVLNLLKSIFDKNSGFDQDSMEVIVLDNGNVDPCKEKIKDYLSRIKYLKNEENEGFPKGYNRAISFATGEYVLMLNSDIEVTKNSLAGILKRAEEYHGNAVISGKLIFPDGTIQDSVFHLPTIGGALKEYFLKIKGAYFMYLPAGRQVLEVDGAVMAVYLIPGKVLNKVGLLDENIFIFFEDVEYARRLKKFGIKIYFDPTLEFLHYHGASTKKQGVTKSYEQLIKSSMYYHGKIYYWLLYYTLLFCQKFSGTRTPGEIR